MKLHDMNYYTTKTMVRNNNWLGQRTDIDGLCQSEGYKLAVQKPQTHSLKAANSQFEGLKLTSGSFASGLLLRLALLLCLIVGGVNGTWGALILFVAI